MHPLIVPYSGKLSAYAAALFRHLQAESDLFLGRKPTDNHPRADATETYAVPRQDGAYNPRTFKAADWMFVIQVQVGQYSCSALVVVDENLPAIETRCQCRDWERTAECDHLAALASVVDRGALGPFRGARVSDRWSTQDSSGGGLTADMVEAFEAEFEPMTYVPLGDDRRIGIQVKSDGYGAGLRVVLIKTAGEDAYDQCEAIKDLGELGSDDPSERIWIDRARALVGDHVEYVQFMIAADVATAEDFAAAGRLIDLNVRPIRFEHDFGDSLAWTSAPGGSQKLGWAPGARAQTIWASKEFGVVYQPAHCVMRSVGLSDVDLGRIMEWPAVEEADLEEITEALRSNAELRALPLPRPVERATAREVEMTWRCEIELDSDHVLHIRLQPVVEGQVVEWSPRRTVHIKRGEEWLRYDNESRRAVDAMEELARTGFVIPKPGIAQLRLNAWHHQQRYWAVADAPRIVANMQNRIPLLNEIPVRWLGLAQINLCAAQPVEPEVSCTLRQDKPHDPIELVLTIKADGKRIVPKEFFSGQLGGFLLAAGGDVAEAPNELCFDGITPTLWGTLNRLRWMQAIDPVLPLYRAARQKGKTLLLDRGALARVLAAGDPVPSSPVADAVAASITDLLSAKTADAPEHAQVERIDACQYWPFQRQAIAWLTALRRHGFGGVLADDRGLGKTLEVLGAAVLHLNARRRAGDPAPPVLVLVERKEKKGWSDHLRTHLSAVDAHWEHGKTRQRDPELLASKEIVLTTYDLFIRNLDMFLALAPEFVFCDEAVSLKNADSVRWRSVNAFTGATIVPITGTPVDRNIDHLWSLVSVAVPGLLGRQGDFRGQYAAAVEGGNPFALEQLRKTLAPFVLRRTKAQLKGQIPDKREIVQSIEMAPAEATAYERLRSRMDAERRALCQDKPFHQAKFQMAGLAERLRVQCAQVGSAQQPTSKGTYLVEMCEQLIAAGHRLMIFSHFNAQVHAISALLRGRGISTAEYVGANAAKRDRELTLFKEGHMQVLVLSAWGSSGLDCPEADTVIIADTWINMGQDDQMGDRAHRLVSTRDVTVFKLSMAGTIEQFACQFLERNRAGTEGLFAEGQGVASKIGLGRDDYDAMFEISPER